MQSVNIAELKNNLSYYLRQVRQGTELTIKDRNRIIARLVPAAPAPDYDAELLELAAQGKVKLPEQPVDEAFIEEMLKCELPRMKTKGKAGRKLLQKIMDEERDGR
ncbi:MAG TPA: type II toxin-antitoxin system prevent-host-death family antitoxin [Blastocatellia bacterium]|nr:type II toxin-antitoxin system prevent-host-death family antitoxin [Blastocatellia bacterium]